jgi:hypothetical protein
MLVLAEELRGAPPEAAGDGRTTGGDALTGGRAGEARGREALKSGR